MITFLSNLASSALASTTTTASLVAACSDTPFVKSGLNLFTGSLMLLSAPDVTGPINNLVNMVLNVFAALGVILVAFGVFTFVSNIDGHDNSQKIRAGLTIAGGILLCMIRPIINGLGITGVSV